MRPCGLWVGLVLAWPWLAHSKPIPVLPKPSKPVVMRFEAFGVDYQHRTVRGDVLVIQARGSHSSYRKHALRLQDVDFVVVSGDAKETVIVAQPRFKTLFGKESANYLKTGVPFSYRTEWPVPRQSERYVVHWQDETREVSAQRLGKQAAKATIKRDFQAK